MNGRKGGVLNVREKGSSDERWWSPDRDITVVFPKAMRAVFHELGDGIGGQEMIVMDALGVTPEDIGRSATLYGKLVRAVMARGNLLEVIEESDFRFHRSQAVVGMVFLDKMTRLFAGKYGATLHKGEPDPNGENLEECETLLRQFNRPLTWWSRTKIRARLMWVILTCPLRSTGQ